MNSTNDETPVDVELVDSNANSKTQLDPAGSDQPRPVSKRSLKSKFAPIGWLIRGIVNAGLLVGAIVVSLFLVGYAQRTGWILPQDEPSSSSADTDGEEKRYICPMMCVPPTTQPGRCPVCGMELVEAASGGGGDGVSILIEPAARRLIGISTEMSTLRSVTRTIRTVGSIEYDESRLSTISAYVDGRLEKVFADYVGVPVKEGDDLALIYSPELYTAQTEYVLSLGSRGKSRFIDDTNLLAMGKENLHELGLSDEQIIELNKTRKPKSRVRVKSPQQGTVIEKMAIEGDYVKTGQTIYRIADLSTVWMMLDLFPDDAALIRFGQEVEAEISSAPGIVFTGRVAFIDPTVNRKTRSVRVRVEMLNIDGRLRPGDYATARVMVPAIPQEQTYDPSLAGKFISPMHPQVIRDEPGLCPICDMDLIPTTQLGFSSEPLPEHQSVTVPRSAVLMAGSNSVIYVETEPGRFQVRRVSIGALTQQDAIIAEGLNVGERVAINGNFLLDSQSQLAGNPSLLDPSKAPSYAPGPLKLPTDSPVQLAGDSANEFDRAYAAYFEIQAAFAADATAPPVAVNTLVESLVRLVATHDIPDEAQTALQTARVSATRLTGPLDASRIAFRSVSHGLLRAAAMVRGPETKNKLTHYYCPMVPGGGGDWLQPGDKLKNPYWGSEMLDCGELVKDMSVEPVIQSPATTDSSDPFEGMELEELEL